MSFPQTHPTLARALAAKGFDDPTPVQAAVLAEGAFNRDLLVSAQTGSGKTVAFGLALATTLLGEAETFERAAEPLALIVAPTRELALQVQRELVWLYGESKARVIACIGGMDSRLEQKMLASGCHIIVGTPGRLRDHLERGKLDPSALRAVVLDEADEMLDLGFREDLQFILDATPASRRTLLFSATIPPDIANLAREYQKDALRIDTVGKNKAHTDIEYHAIRIAPNDLEHAVVNLLRYHESPCSMVFCATREAVKRLHNSLVERGFNAVSLSGEMAQKERTAALQSLRDGRSRVCVATDVAARGIDLPDLGLVIHAELPNNRDTLLHRSGRTGRAGKKGICALLVPHTRRRRAEQLIQLAGVKAEWMQAPTAEAINAKDQARFLEDPIFTDEVLEDDLVLAKLIAEKYKAEDIAAILVKLYRQKLPAPEEMLEQPNYDPATREKGAKRERRDEVAGEFVLFKMNIGRNKNADPRWLLPLICRQGHVTKRDIGAIRIFERETRVEILAEVAEKFAQAVRKVEDDDVRITPADNAMPDENRAPRGDFDRKPRFSKDRDGETRPPRARFDKDGDPRPARFAKPESAYAKPDGKVGESRFERKQRRDREFGGGQQEWAPKTPREDDSDFAHMPRPPKDKDAGRAVVKPTAKPAGKPFKADHKPDTKAGAEGGKPKFKPKPADKNKGKPKRFKAKRED